MVDTGIFCTRDEVLRKAGANASSTATAEDYTNDFIAQAESVINVMTRYNWSDAYASLNDDVKGILKEAASNLAAIYVINYDMSGFTSRAEAETMIDILWANFQRDIKLLEDQANQTFVKNA